MQGFRFDTWTRRRFGLAAGGMAATLARLTSPEDADARNKNRKKRKMRCRQDGQVCRQSGKRKRCCQGKQCADFDGQRFRCCKAIDHPCSAGSECCSGHCIVDRCGVT